MVFLDLAANLLYTVLCLVPGFISLQTVRVAADLDVGVSEFEKSTWSLIGSGASLSVLYFLYAAWTIFATGCFGLIHALDLGWVDLVAVYPRFSSASRCSWATPARRCSSGRRVTRAITSPRPRRRLPISSGLSNQDEGIGRTGTTAIRVLSGTSRMASCYCSQTSTFNRVDREIAERIRSGRVGDSTPSSKRRNGKANPSETDQGER